MLIPDLKNVFFGRLLMCHEMSPTQVIGLALCIPNIRTPTSWNLKELINQGWCQWLRKIARHRRQTPMELASPNGSTTILKFTSISHLKTKSACIQVHTDKAHNFEAIQSQWIMSISEWLDRVDKFRSIMKLLCKIWAIEVRYFRSHAASSVPVFGVPIR